MQHYSDVKLFQYYITACIIKSYVRIDCLRLFGTFLAICTHMKIAVPEWQGRISPVLDAASKVLLVDIEETRQMQRQEKPLVPADPWARAEAIRQMGAEVLICGAVSRQLEAALRSVGIQVICNICGPVEAVLAAFREGRLDENVFLMPGCCRRRQRFRGGGRHDRSWS